ncbi:hypothetical protein QAD02_015313 [Eretmocerus hayati]|uniref:Uncharacterized protein n=1 Tax=Eretmocerus hayati TaxID=131215 RepID=A0ACC2P9J6_9HYME|nr:hypothetical protein QAD02_015313 [Eretmocerus hayati]
MAPPAAPQCTATCRRYLSLQAKISQEKSQTLVANALPVRSGALKSGELASVCAGWPRARETCACTGTTSARPDCQRKNAAVPVNVPVDVVAMEPPPKSSPLSNLCLKRPLSVMWLGVLVYVFAVVPALTGEFGP